jgi:hypothetical protein
MPFLLAACEKQVLAAPPAWAILGKTVFGARSRIAVF